SSGFSSIFQSAGGPPLILVCIAAGLLLGAFVGMVAMRRFRPVVVVHRAPGGGRPGPGPELGEKPALFDIHLQSDPHDVLGGSGEWGAGADKWARISPFAAVYLPPSEPDPSTATADDTPPRPSPTARLLALVRSHLRRAPAEAEALPLRPTAPEPRAVQLAVAVCMPAPPRLRDACGADEDQPVPDCCIGTAVSVYRPEPV
ncbi:hypothetical protein BD413DRAFT_445399, partial [Trametes elegans]